MNSGVRVRLTGRFELPPRSSSFRVITLPPSTGAPPGTHRPAFHLLVTHYLQPGRDSIPNGSANCGIFPVDGLPI